MAFDSNPYGGDLPAFGGDFNDVFGFTSVGPRGDIVGFPGDSGSLSAAIAEANARQAQEEAARQEAERQSQVDSLYQNLASIFGRNPLSLGAGKIAGVSPDQLQPTDRDLFSNLIPFGGMVIPGLETLYDYFDPNKERTVPDDFGLGNVDGVTSQIGRFLSDPSFGNIPTIDSARALQAYKDALSGIGGLVDERGFTGKGYEQAALDKALNIFNTLTPTSDIGQLLSGGVGRNLADEALFNKEQEFKTTAQSKAGELFPSDYSTSLFDENAFNSALQNVLTNRFNEASGNIARASSRGNLNTIGSQVANQQLQSQRPQAESRIGEVGSSLKSAFTSRAGDIAGRAQQGASSVSLSNPEFDFTPFIEEGNKLRTEFPTDLTGRLNSAIGSEQLFNVPKALQEAGSKQGLVSGSSNLLDALSSKKTTTFNSTGRGLNNRRSEVF